MSIMNPKSRYFYLIPALLFAVLSAVFLLVFYREMLFTAQWRTSFIEGEQFRHSLLIEPFGWMSYLGCWFTQAFYKPVLGVGFLIVIWMASWLAGTKAFELQSGWNALMLLPLSCLLLSITDVGYWIYILCRFGYWFSQSLGYMCMLFLQWGLVSLHRGWLRTVIQTVVCIAIYPVLGWYSYLLALCLVLRQHNWWCLLMVLAPAFWQQTLYGHVSMYSMWIAGFPLFDNNAILSQRPLLPFYALAAFTLIMAVIPCRRELSFRQWGIGVAGLSLASISAVWCGSFKDYNYQAEMRMSRMAMDDDWEGILAQSKVSAWPSRTMVMLKNIALINTGQLGSRSYALSNDGCEINNPDSLNLNIMQIAAPLVYYNHGMLNFATRWCIENSVGYGYSPYYLQMMARCAQATGEQALLKRVLDLLHTHAWYADWQPRPVTSVVSDLRDAFGNLIDSDNNSCEHYIVDIFSKSVGSDYSIVHELLLFYATMEGSPSLFWPAFVEYYSTHSRQPLPQHYQEAYVFFMDNYPVDLAYDVTVSPLLADSYKTFMQQLSKCQQSGASRMLAGEVMRERWGKTYWWYQCFGRLRY